MREDIPCRTRKGWYVLNSFKENIMTTILDNIKTHICEEIFQNGYPSSVEGKHPFDFFMEADVESANGVDDSILGTKYDFEAASEYGFENIRSIRGLMQAKLNDLEKLLTNILSSYTHVLQLSRDEFVNYDDFHNIANHRGALLHREGTADEYVTFKVLERTGSEI